jgi:hypothetical protein
VGRHLTALSVGALVAVKLLAVVAPRVGAERSRGRLADALFSGVRGARL